MWGLKISLDSCSFTSSCLCGFEALMWHARFVSQSCDTWTKTLTWGQTVPPVSLRAPQLLSALCLNSISTKNSQERHLENLWHLTKTGEIQLYIALKPSLGEESLGWGCSVVPSAQAIFWLRLDVRCLGERQVVSPALAAVPRAWHGLKQTGGQPEWALMRLKPHQRLPYLSSLHSTCATLSAWWEPKLPQNSPSSCNYSNSWFVITQINSTSWNN